MHWPYAITLMLFLAAAIAFNYTTHFEQKKVNAYYYDWYFVFVNFAFYAGVFLFALVLQAAFKKDFSLFKKRKVLVALFSGDVFFCPMPILRIGRLIYYDIISITAMMIGCIGVVWFLKGRIQPCLLFL